MFKTFGLALLLSGILIIPGEAKKGGHYRHITHPTHHYMHHNEHGMVGRNAKIACKFGEKAEPCKWFGWKYWDTCCVKK